MTARRLVLVPAFVLIALLVPSSSAIAHAGGDECVALGGTVVSGECVVSTFQNKNSGAHGGSFDIAETLRITGSGRIDASVGVLAPPGIAINVAGDLILETPTVATGGQIEANDTNFSSTSNAGPITLNVTGNMEMQAGSKILAENTISSGRGGDITIDVDGNMAMAGVDASNPGAVVSSSVRLATTAGSVGGHIKITVGDETAGTGTFFMGGGTTTYGSETGAKVLSTSNTAKAGNIDITAGDGTTIEPGAVVEAGGSAPRTTLQQGGKIFLVAGCGGLTTGGRVTSKGPDPGADLVHLEACDVLITGLVESTGKGHAANAPNSCDNVNDGLFEEEFRPGKPAAATGCVEVWAQNITIDATGINAGEVNADIGNGGPDGTTWIDLFAEEDITVLDGPGNDKIRDNLSGITYLNTFAVHARTISGSDNNPGVVTAKAKTGTLMASGDALAAHTTANGSDGGDIVTQAAGDVTLDLARLTAAGDFVAGGAIGNGGLIDVRSFQGALSWQNGEGDVRPPDGEIFLTACGATTTTGTNFNGETPVPVVDCSVQEPSFPLYVEFPECDCEDPPECKWCTKSAVLSQVWQNPGGGDPAKCCLVPDILVDVTADPANDEILPEELGSNEPATSSIQAAVDYVNGPDWDANDPTPGDGEIFIGVTAMPCGTGVVSTGECIGQTGRGPGGDGTENVVISNTNAANSGERLNVFGCSVDLYPDDPNQPVVEVTNASTGKVTVMDIHAKGSNVAGYYIHDNPQQVVVKNARAEENTLGYWIEEDNDLEVTGSPGITKNDVGVLQDGNGVVYRTNRVEDNDGVGMHLIGDQNEINGKNSDLNGGHAIWVEGNQNNIHDADVYSNSGDGIRVIGNKNIVKNNDIGDKGKGNTGDGVHVEGKGNRLEENDVFGNTGDGLDVSGGTAVLGEQNVLKKNDGGDDSTGKGNGGNGIYVHDDVGNGTSTSPVVYELEENVTEGNTLHGILVTSGGHQLKKNQSKANGDCEFLVSSGNFDAKDNKSNGATVLPNVLNAAFLTTCQGTP